jgi:hypothetical protein
VDTVKFGKGPAPQEQPATPQDERGLDFAWRTHSAIGEWTAKVDTKSSIVLSLGGVILGFLITLTARGRLLADQHGWRLFTLRTGLGVISLGVILAAYAVFPRLKRRQAKQIWKDNYVYFGHLRHWDPKKLKAALLNQTIDEQLEVLAKQLVATSKISWNKHAALQRAMMLIFGGVAIVALGVVWPR